MVFYKRSPGHDKPSKSWALVMLLLLAVLASCTREQRIDNFPRAAPVLGIQPHMKMYDAVGYPGRLVLRHGCVMLATLHYHVGFPPQMVAWPQGFHARWNGPGLGFHVNDAKGHTLATNGDRIVLGGGPIGAKVVRSSNGGNLPSKCMVSHVIAVDGDVGQPDSL